MSESNSPYDADPNTPGTQLDPALLAAIQEAVAAGMASGPLPPAPPSVGLTMAVTPKLGLKQPALDDPALITDINDNMTILDEAVTATSVATLTNKTLTAPIINNPTITGWTNAQHSHLDAAGAGQLDGNAIVSGDIGTGFVVRETYVQDYLNAGADLVDPVVRDTLWWGPIGTAAPDAYLKRTGPKALQTDSTVGVGVAPGAWDAAVKAVRVGEGAIMGVPGTAQFQVLNNSLWNGTNTVAVSGTNPGHRIRMDGSGFFVENAPAVAAGAVQTFTTRLTVAQGGQTTITADNDPVVSNVLGGGALVHYKAARAGATAWMLASNPSNGFEWINNVGASKLQIAPIGTVTLTPDAEQYAMRVANTGWGIRVDCQDPRQLEFSHSGYTDVTVRNYQGGLWFYPNNIDPTRAMVFGSDGSLTLKVGSTTAALLAYGAARVGSGAWGGSATMEINAAAGYETLNTGYVRYGLVVSPSHNVIGGATGVTVASINAGLGGTNAGQMDNAYAAILSGPTISNTGTISNAAALYVTNPTLGGAVPQNRAIIHGNTGASLTTAGAWTNAPSWAANKEDIRYLDAAEVASLADWFTGGWKPARYRTLVRSLAEGDPDALVSGTGEGDYESFFAVLDDMPQSVREAICVDEAGGISTKDMDGFLAALLKNALQRIAALEAAAA